MTVSRALRVVMPATLMIAGALACVFAMSAPYISFGEQEQFVLYQRFGWARREVFDAGMTFVFSGVAIFVVSYLIKVGPALVANVRTWIDSSVKASREIVKRAVPAKLQVIFRDAQAQFTNTVRKISVKNSSSPASVRLFLGIRLKSLVVLAASIAVFSIFLFRFQQINDVGLANHNDALLYYSYDGVFHLTRLVMSNLWTSANLSLDINTILGNGGNINSVNDLLIPQHYFVHLFPSLFSPVTLIFLFLVEVFAAIYLLFRVFGISRRISFFAAWLTCVFNFPLIATPLVNFGFFSTPHMAHIYSLGLVLLACFWRLGKGGWRQNLSMVFLLAIVGFVTLISSPHRAPFLIVFLITIGPFIWMYAPAKEYLPKLFLTLIAVGLIFLTGIFDVYEQIELVFNFPEIKHTSIIDLVIQTAKAIFIPDFQSLGKLFTDTALSPTPITPAIGMPHAPPVVRFVQLFALASALYGIIYFPSRSERMICAVAIVFTWYLANNQLDYGGRIYFIESHVWPFMGACLGLGIRDAANAVQQRMNRFGGIAGKFDLSASKITYPLIIVSSLGLFLTTIQSPRGWAYPLEHNKVTQFLNEKIGVSPGDEFKGNYVSVVGWHEGIVVDEKGRHWTNVISRIDYEILKKTGADLRVTSPMFFSLPTVHANYSLNNPFYNVYNYSDSYLNKKITIFLRATFQKKTGMLWLMGNRYFVTDEDLPFPVALEMPVENLGIVRVYDLGDANLGYSPARAKGYEDWSAYLEPVMAGDLDPRRVTAVEPRYAGTYKPANKILYTLERGGVRIRASGHGRSMVVVPFNYSTCLIPRVRKGGPVEVTRANVINTAIIFEDEIDVSLDFRFGPFENRNCIREDLEVARKILKFTGLP